MERIKFLGNYVKLHNQTSATLLQVNFVDIREVSKELIEYDTLKTDGSRYEFIDNYYIQLIFLGNFGIPFSTLRSMNYEKMKYYVSNLNKEFKIEVIGE